MLVAIAVALFVFLLGLLSLLSEVWARYWLTDSNQWRGVIMMLVLAVFSTVWAILGLIAWIVLK